MPVGFRLSFGGSGTQVRAHSDADSPMLVHQSSCRLMLIRSVLLHLHFALVWAQADSASGTLSCARVYLAPFPLRVPTLIRALTDYDNQGSMRFQARAVIDGLPADIAALALPLDVMKIADAGLMRQDWRKAAPNDGVVATSVVAIVVRPGNPKGIKDWDDLTRWAAG